MSTDRKPEYAEIARRRIAGEEAKPRPEQPSLFDSTEGS